MILVDTQAVIWLSHADEKLSESAKRRLVEGRIQGILAISDFTLLEIALLVSRRRVTLPSSLGDYLAFVESLFTVLPMTPKIAERSVQFGPSYPNDPADQVIGATAIVHGLQLVTSDAAIRASGEVNCVW